MTDTDPSAHAQVTVPVGPTAAFGAFTAGLGSWWPREYSWGPEGLDRHELEPRVGGRVSESRQDGGRLDWGRVTTWDPPVRLVLEWWIGPDRVPTPDSPSRVTVGFHSMGDATRVVVVHDRFAAHGRDEAAAYAEAMDGPAGWQGMLDGYAATLDA